MIKSYSKNNISKPYLSVGRNYFFILEKGFIDLKSSTSILQWMKVRDSKKNSELQISDCIFSFISIKKIKYLLNY